MKLVISLLVFLLSLQRLIVVAGVESFNLSCPSSVGESQTFTVIESSAEVTLAVPGSGLCTLALENNGIYIPIARSYDGYDWEKAGGSFVNSWNDWNCSGSSTCTGQLQVAGTYVLRNRIISTTTTPNTDKARFLESASFGTTRASLNNLGSYTSYIQEQANIPATYHREYFRRHMNARWEFHHPKFAAHLNPCNGNINTTWRRQMITEKDKDKVVTVNNNTGTNNLWQITIDGHVRGLVQQIRYENADFWMNDIFTDGDVREICADEEEFRRGIYKIDNNEGKCRTVITDDWLIDFPDEGYQPPSVLNGTLPALSDGKWELISNYQPSYRYTGLIDETMCSTIQGYGINSPPIFAKTIDGEWLIYDPRIDLKDNTPENPIQDGGQNDLVNGHITMCANVARNYQNENGCIMADTACTVGSTDPATSLSTGILVCGSPGEVSNDKTVIDSWLDMSSLTSGDAQELNLREDTSSWNSYERQRELVWTEIVLNSPDQLRQRIAWALSQIFSLPKISLRDINTNTEPLLYYYDIFVKNAFGNYMDILRDISYSPLMAESLSYLDSKSVALSIRHTGNIYYPDENFARELMQLFTIGVIKLNIDGTPVLDTNTGKPIRTYTNEDIMSFARAWTGFDRHELRSNVETKGKNKIDPMYIKPLFRDLFPKTDLNNGYIGDGYPFCIDLPNKSFLRKGAKYRLLGTNPLPENYIDDIEWIPTSPNAKRMILTSDSILYQKLCSAGSEGSCSYPGVVTLDTNLACTGMECNVDTVRTVQVENVYYEYIHIPCVQQTFFQNPRLVTKNGYWDDPTCAPSNLPIAGESCCTVGIRRRRGSVSCNYAGERMVFETAKNRCESIGKELCRYKAMDVTEECPYKYFRWTTETCKLRVKVNTFGQIAVVHGGHDDNGENRGPTVFLRNETQTFFKAYWDNGEYPKVADGCTGGSCTIFDGSCLCDTTVIEEPVFTSPPSGSNEILEKLKFGHVPPDLHDAGVYQSGSSSDFIFHTKTGTCCDADTVFEVVDGNGITRFFKNLKSTVTIDGSVFSFRNPVQFNNMLPTEYSKAEAEQETDAVLSYLLHHPNTAPFVALRLIQRFGQSNPSPRYVKTVAEAFKAGQFSSDGVSFGSGKYGDMLATVAAILLDREVRSHALSHDPTFGAMREPIIKILAFFRAMEINTITPMLELDSMSKKIGQMAHEQPSVFSFFRFDYSPPGDTTLSYLAAPEAEVMTSSNLISSLNGLFSFITDGLLSCDGTFTNDFGSCSDDPNALITVNPSEFASTEEMIDELGTLLTSGRLHVNKKQTIQAAVGNETDPSIAFQTVLQLLVTSPEFHSTSNVDPDANPGTAVAPEATAIPSPGYKAVIHLFLNGGCDSFNVLAPHPTCPLNAQYKTVRGSVGLQDAEMIQIGASDQVCSSFGVHYGLPFLKQLYDEGDLLFVANAGVMTQPVNKDNYSEMTLTQLFAHNSMEEEISRLDPTKSKFGTGTLGRMTEALHSKGYKTGRTAVESVPWNLATRVPLPDSIVTIDTNEQQVLTLNPPSLETYVESLNGHLGSHSGVFGEAWSKLLLDARNQTEELQGLLSVETQTVFSDTDISKRMALIAQLIGSREARNVDRDFFFVSMEGYDTHDEVISTLEEKFVDLNAAIEEFVTEMKALGVWDDVVIVQTSDFGRTLTPNSGSGTDHGWGGNVWVTGGSVKGGRIVGQYPTGLDPDDDHIDRGRVIPTTSFDSIFNGVADWVGLDDATDLDKVLPNRNNFNPDLFYEAELFV